MYDSLALDFGRWDVFILSIFPAAINFAVFCYVWFKFPKNSLNTNFGVFVLFLSIWQCSDGMMRLSSKAESAGDWYRISELAVLIIISQGLNFILRFTQGRKKYKRRIFSVLLFAPAAVFSLAIQLKLDAFNVVASDTWHWVVNPMPTFITSVIYTWIATGALGMLTLLLVHYLRQPQRSIQKKQGLLLLLGISLPVLGGVIAEIIFPLLIKINDVPISAPLVTAFSIFSLIAIKKYNMLDYSPRHQWEKIIETMNEALLIVDNNDRIMYANGAFCQTLGYGFDEIRGKAACELLCDQEDVQTIKGMIEERKLKKTGQYEIELKTKSGGKVWMIISGSPYLDAKGNVIGSIGIQTNITRLKESEKAILHSEARLKQAQAVAHVGSWELTFATGRSSWSEEACRIYGVPIEQKDNQSYETFLSYIHPEDLHYVKSEVDRSNKTLGNASFKHRILRSDGAIRYIHSVAQFEFNSFGYPVGMVGVCHDITEQKQTENALLESEDRIDSFISKSLLSIYFVDPVTKKIVYYNQAFLDLLGYSKDDMQNMSVYDFVDHPRENVDARLDEIAREKKLSVGERQWKRKDGSIVYVLVSGLSQKRDGVDLVYTAAQDITDRRIAEEKLKAANQELETFIYKSAHDIRSPLASIIGLAHIGILESGEKLAQQHFGTIKHLSTKLDLILMELVKAMRIKDIDNFNSEIDFVEITNGIRERLEYYDGYSKIQINLKVELVDKLLSSHYILETIFQNMIENSIKYRRRDEPVCFLHISVVEEVNTIRIIFEDNGIGIEESVRPKIFDMYYRGTTTSNGLGLGLYLVKKGVDRLGGTIGIKSSPGRGTTFTIMLPKNNLRLKISTGLADNDSLGKFRSRQA